MLSVRQTASTVSVPGVGSRLRTRCWTLLAAGVVQVREGDVWRERVVLGVEPERGCLLLDVLVEFGERVALLADAEPGQADPAGQ